MPSPFRTITCEICGNPSETRSLAARTCSRRCGAILREREHPSPGAPERQYPPELVERVQQMYEDGATIREIGIAIGPGVKIQHLVEKYVAERRPAIPRDQSGVKNPAWKGDDATYGAFHLRVEAARGKPAECASCDAVDPHSRYHWANMTGHYEDIFDYIRLCPACHIRFDTRRRAALGHRTATMRGGGFHV